MVKSISSKKIQKSLPLFLILASLVQGCAQPNGQISAPVASQGQMCPRSADRSNFFEDVSSATALPPDEEVAPLRYRNVVVNVKSLKAALRRSVSQSVQLPMFNDKPLDIFVEKVDNISQDNIVVTGHITGQEYSDVTIVINEEVMIANIHPTDGARYAVKYMGNGTHSIQEVDPTDAEGSDCLTVENPEAHSSDTVNAQALDTNNDTHDEDAPMVAMAATPVVDMLVAYTPAAKAKAGGAAAIKAVIQMGIADSNKAFANSGVNMQVRLAGTMEVRHNDTNNFSGNLDSLKGRTDGRWDEVHAERARLGADQVTLVGVYANNGTAGIGFIKASAGTAFSIVKLSAFNIYSFTHELGHNIGLNHSDGYLNSGGRFRTIMAYGSYTRILRFSNPTLSYNNYSTGTSTKNSARILNRYGTTTASFAVSKTVAAGFSTAQTVSPERAADQDTNQVSDEGSSQSSEPCP